MNGREIEKLLTLIDESILENEQAVRREVFEYLQSNQDDVVRQLMASGHVAVPIRRGSVDSSIDLSIGDLEAATA